MSGFGFAGSSAQDAVSRENWEQYRKATLEQIGFQRAFGWKFMGMGFLVAGGNLVVFFWLFLVSLEFRESPGLVFFAIVIYAAFLSFVMVSARKIFQQAMKLEQELDEQERFIEQCKENDERGDIQSIEGECREE